MSVWHKIAESLSSHIEIVLTVCEARVLRQVAEDVMAEQVDVLIREGKSPWEVLDESLFSNRFDKDYWNISPTKQDMVLNDKEAEAIEDATGQMGMEPVSKDRSRKLIANPQSAMSVFQALQSNPAKYSATLGQQGYQNLLRKIGNPLKQQMGAKKFGQTNVRAQDMAGAAGAQQAGKTDWSKGKATVQDPAQQQRTADMEDPEDWFGEAKSHWVGALSGLAGMGLGAGLTGMFAEPSARASHDPDPVKMQQKVDQNIEIPPGLSFGQDGNIDDFGHGVDCRPGQQCTDNLGVVPMSQLDPGRPLRNPRKKDAEVGSEPVAPAPVPEPKLESFFGEED
jgi:hypothetical protein